MSDGVPLREHLEALREADLRRYDDLRAADQRALQIKEAGDAKALDLARDIQIYKDEKANELREQINRERGLYATKDDIAPLRDFVSGQIGRNGGVTAAQALMFSLAGLFFAAVGLYLALSR